MGTFHPFPRLPLELRERIWELTLEPRTVEVRLERGPTYVPVHSRLKKYYVTLRSSTPVPPILQACQEARNCGLYERGFAEVQDRGYDDPHRYVWINFDIDIVSIGDFAIQDLFPVAPKIKRLQFLQEYSEAFFHWIHRDLLKFSRMEEIRVVCEDDMCNWHQMSQQLQWPVKREKLIFIGSVEGCVMGSVEMDDMYDELRRWDRKTWEIKKQHGEEGLSERLAANCEEEYSTNAGGTFTVTPTQYIYEYQGKKFFSGR